jgi:hypothetical protein
LPECHRAYLVGHVGGVKHAEEGRQQVRQDLEDCQQHDAEADEEEDEGRLEAGLVGDGGDEGDLRDVLVDVGEDGLQQGLQLRAHL